MALHMRIVTNTNSINTNTSTRQSSIVWTKWNAKRFSVVVSDTCMMTYTNLCRHAIPLIKRKYQKNKKKKTIRNAENVENVWLFMSKSQVTTLFGGHNNRCRIKVYMEPKVTKSKRIRTEQSREKWCEVCETQLNILFSHKWLAIHETKIDFSIDLVTENEEK